MGYVPYQEHKDQRKAQRTVPVGGVQHPESGEFLLLPQQHSDLLQQPDREFVLADRRGEFWTDREDLRCGRWQSSDRAGRTEKHELWAEVHFLSRGGRQFPGSLPVVDSPFRMRFPRWLSLLLLFSSASAASPPQHASTTKAAPRPPNVILITLDTTRADRMGFLGSDRGLTPNLDALARHGIVFTRAYSQVPLTTASHTTILTGTYPQFNHVNDFGVPISPRLPYLPDLLHHAGYHTAAFVASLVLDPLDGTAPGFDRGFDFYDAGFSLRRHGADRYKTVERRGGE